MRYAPEHFTFDKENTKELREVYDTAVADGAEQFVFHGHTLVVDYAKYLLQYLEGRFK